MHIAIDDYAYTMVQMATLKKNLVTDDDWNRLSNIVDPHSLSYAINEFFPGVLRLISELTLLELEKGMFHIYFSELKRLIKVIPEDLHKFILLILKEYEIWNIKTVCMGIIYDRDPSEIKDDIWAEPEVILGNQDLVKNLTYASNIDELNQMMSRNREYQEIIERGIYYYRLTKDSFILESLLDRYYHNQYTKADQILSKKFYMLVQPYLQYRIIYYNLITIFNAIKKEIKQELLGQIVIFHEDFYKRFFEALSSSRDQEEFYSNLESFLSKGPLNSQLNIQNKTMKCQEDFEGFLKTLKEKTFETIKPNFGSYETDMMTIKTTISYVITRREQILSILRLFVKIFHKIKE